MYLVFCFWEIKVNFGNLFMMRQSNYSDYLKISYLESYLDLDVTRPCLKNEIYNKVMCLDYRVKPLGSAN